MVDCRHILVIKENDKRGLNFVSFIIEFLCSCLYNIQTDQGGLDLRPRTPWTEYVVVNIHVFVLQPLFKFELFWAPYPSRGLR